MTIGAATARGADRPGRPVARHGGAGHVEAVREAVFDVLTREQVRQLAQITEAVAQVVQRVQAGAGHPAALPWERR